MSTYRELSELSGYTARVSDLLDTMDDLKKGNFHKKLVSSASTEENAKVLQGRGTVVRAEGEIVFDKVPIVTPNGDVLIKEMSFVVKPGVRRRRSQKLDSAGCGLRNLFSSSFHSKTCSSWAETGAARVPCSGSLAGSGRYTVRRSLAPPPPPPPLPRTAPADPPSPPLHLQAARSEPPRQTSSSSSPSARSSQSARFASSLSTQPKRTCRERRTPTCSRSSRYSRSAISSGARVAWTRSRTGAARSAGATSSASRW